MGFMKRFGPHYAIERFGVMFIALVLAMATLLGVITNRQVERSRVALGGRAVYTTGFRMSRTNTACSVQGLFVDSAYTKCLVLLRFGDMSLMPQSADDYSLTVGAVNTRMAYEEIQSRPAGLFYMFGTTGYAAIYLQDMSGFPSQILGVIIDAKSSLVTGGEGEIDRGVVYFNPGGAYATKAAFLDQDQWDFFQVCEEAMTRNAEIDARNKLTQDLDDMLQQLILIREYEARLRDDRMGIVVPPRPKYIDDEIYAVVTEDLKTKRLADCERLLMENYTTEGGGWLNNAGDRGWYAKDVTLFLDASFVVPGGHDFTWQTGRILTGYLVYLTETRDILQWRNYMNRKAAASNPTVPSFASELERCQWIRAGDGSTFVVTDAATAARTYSEPDQNINFTINLLLEAWQKYYDLKVQYETVDLPALLQLEISANDMFKSYTVNTSGVRIV